MSITHFSPYLAAFTAYQSAGEMEVPWTEAMEIHLQRGAIVSTPALFVMARPVAPNWPENFHPDISHLHPGTSHTWHIYAAAGDLRQLLDLAQSHGIRSITYQRRGRERLHWLFLKTET